MCGRFAFWADKNTILNHFQLTAAPEFQRSYNITPASMIPVVRHDTGRELVNCRWGFVPHWADSMRVKPINARAESLATKPFFRAAFRSQRCLVPASGFYEWQAVAAGGKQPYFIQPDPPGVFAFAGLWDAGPAPQDYGLCCAIITTAADPRMADIHDRMPVIIAPDDYDQWLTRGGVELLRPYTGALRIHPVGARVNRPGADGEELIRPLQRQAPS